MTAHPFLPLAAIVAALFLVLPAAMMASDDPCPGGSACKVFFGQGATGRGTGSTNIVDTWEISECNYSLEAYTYNTLDGCNDCFVTSHSLVTWELSGGDELGLKLN